MLDTFHPTDPNYDWAAHYKRNRDRIARPIAPPAPAAPVKETTDTGCDHNAHVRCRRVRLPSASILQIVEGVAYRYGVTAADILGPERHQLTCLARQELCAFLRDEKRWSYPRIGRLLGRDHTTALHHCRRHKARLKSAKPDAIPFTTTKCRETGRHRNYEVQIHEVAEAVRLYRAGLTDKQISVELGMRQSAVLFCVRCYIGGDRATRAARGQS